MLLCISVSSLYSLSYYTVVIDCFGMVYCFKPNLSFGLISINLGEVLVAQHMIWQAVNCIECLVGRGMFNAKLPHGLA